VSARLLAGLLCFCAAHGIAAEDPGPEVIAATRQAVAQIFSSACAEGKERHASGFVWRDTSTVVTALHVVAGCTKIRVYIASAGKSYDATIDRALNDADLATLHLNSATPARPLLLAPAAPQVTEKLQVVGYLGEVPEIANKRMEVMDQGSNTLKGFLPENLQRLVAQAGSPSLTVRILRLDGSLLPGTSGAPLVNAAGRVSGVGSGGLENGLGGISWAIRAEYVTELNNAPAYAKNRTAAPKQIFFSAETPAGEGVRCGERTLRLLKTRALGELIPSLDDPLAYAQLASTSGLPQAEIEGFRLDSWVDADSGGVVAVPAGTQLKAGNSWCSGFLENGALEVRVIAAKAENIIQVQSKSVAFENSVVGDGGLAWIPDPSFSYMTPRTRADGLVANRKSFLGGTMVPGFGPQVRAASLETLLYRPDVLIGILVINRQYNPPLYQSCAMAPNQGNCAAVLRSYRVWAAAALGSNMTTFPIR
jgi:hypothetical protein